MTAGPCNFMFGMHVLDGFSRLEFWRSLSDVFCFGFVRLQNVLDHVVGKNEQ